MRVSFVLRSAEASSLGPCNPTWFNYRDITLSTPNIPYVAQLSGHYIEYSKYLLSIPNYRDIHMALRKKPSTPWCSRAVPQPSTDPALHRLATEFGWDPACSMQYGRRLLNNNTKPPIYFQLSGHRPIVLYQKNCPLKNGIFFQCDMQQLFICTFISSLLSEATQ
jgi:hypothetical protein